MRSTIFILLPLFLLGCAGGGAYKMPKEEYQERVRTLGVLPLMVDEGSTITHPERQKVIELLRKHNAGKEEQLIDLLRGKKGYFDVRKVSGDPQRLFQHLVRDASLRGKGDETYRRYHFNGRAAAEIASGQVVDAILVIILNGVERTEKRFDRGTSLTYLKAPYNSIQATAAVVLPSGEIAWEYSGKAGQVFLPLQYPDFDEAYYNKTDEVRIRFLSPAGLERALIEMEKGIMDWKKFQRVYGILFNDIVGAMHPALLNPLRGKSEGSAPEVQPTK